jgi:hypothetical protein
MQNRSLHLIITALLIAPMIAGCSRRAVFTGVVIATAATAGAAGVMYARGDLESDLDVDLDRVFKASSKAARDLGYSVGREEVNALDGVIEARSPDEADEKAKDIMIKLKRTEKNGTHCSIRVGVFGNEERSRKILSRIEANLR